MIEEIIINRIQFFLEYKNWSVYKLAKASGLPYSSLNNIFGRKTCPTVPTLERICDGLQISLKDFFSFDENPLRAAGLSDEEESVINLYRTLSSSDKKLLEAYLNGLCKR